MKEVNSPVNTRNTTSPLSVKLPLSPGARSAPGRGDSVPPQPPHGGAASRHSQEPAASLQVTGPEDD